MEMKKIFLAFVLLWIVFWCWNYNYIHSYGVRTTTKNIMGLNIQNINNTRDSQRLLIDRAELHKANNTGNLIDGDDLLQCIQTLLLHGTDKSYKIELGNCDGITINRLTIKDNQFDPGFGDNQTMIKLAHAYLKARGIQ